MGAPGCRGLTRSTVFFLLVSARGPDTNTSHRSRCCSGSSAGGRGAVRTQGPGRPASSHPRAGPSPHPSAAAPAARRWAPSPSSAPGRWPPLSSGPCSLCEDLLRTWARGAAAGHRPAPPAQPCPPRGRPPTLARSLHAVVLLPRGQDALHQAALLQQLGGSSEGPAWGGTTAGPCYPSPLPSPWSAYKERAASVHTHAPPLLTQTRPLPV